MKTKSKWNLIKVPVLLLIITLCPVSAMAANNKGPFKTTNGKHILMHDDEIAGFAAPPQGYGLRHLTGWQFNPDEGFTLTETPLDTKELSPNMSSQYFGLPASAVGRMHTTQNDGIFVVFVDSENYIRVAEYDPATNRKWVSPQWKKAVIKKLNWGYGIGRYLDCATGDFDLDGVDELVIRSPGRMEPFSSVQRTYTRPVSATSVSPSSTPR